MEAEMAAGKPMKQSLAIALDMQRRAPKKKMAEGGMAKDQAKSKPRPTPTEVAKDKPQIVHNEAKQSVSKQPNFKAEMKPSADSRPKMVPMAKPKIAMSGAFKVRDMDDVMQEKLRQHEEHLMRMKNGGTIQDDPDHQALEHNAKVDHEYGDGIEEDQAHDPKRLEDENDMEFPPESEIMESDLQEDKPKYADGGDVDMGQTTGVTLGTKDKGKIKSMGLDIFKAEGGEIGDDEMEMDHHSSITAAIMAKRKQMHDLIDSGSLDEDDAAMFAEGGEVDMSSHSNQLEDEYDEDNQEAIKKENYGDQSFLHKSQPADSNEHGDDLDSDKHDMISQIRSKMKKQKRF